MTTKTLRGYQSRALDELRAAIRAGHRRILLALPTGGGKSVIFSKVIASANEKKNPVLFLVHKRELVRQASGHLKNEGVPHGIIMAGEVMNLDAANQVCSKDTLHRRAVASMKLVLPPARVIVVDEAHRTGTTTYNDILDQYPDAILIGVTATPTRKNGRGLGAQWDKLIVVTTVAELQEMGFLCQTRYMVPAIPDLKNIGTQDGDYVEEQLQKLMDDAKLIGSVVDHWLRYAENRQTIVFATGVSHSMHLRDRFLLAGVPAAHVDGGTLRKERDAIFAAFERGEIRVLCNCNIATEGLDIPDTGCVVLARPTRSIVFHLQSIGRGLRPKEDGSDCLIIDHAGNVLRLGPAEREHEWSLDDQTTVYENDAKRESEKKERKETEYVCGGCGTLFKSSPVCPHCHTPLESHGRAVDTAKGELTLYRVKEEKKPAKKQFSMQEKQRFYSMLLWRAQEKGYQKGWVSHKYQERFGVWPKDMKDQRLIPDAQFNSYMQHLAIKFAKGKEKHGSRGSS
jgi:superfamily II DNA or RNA helicase